VYVYESTNGSSASWYIWCNIYYIIAKMN
jgi:hypothetical protein